MVVAHFLILISYGGKMKKLLSIFLCLLLVCSMAACKSSPDEENQNIIGEDEKDGATPTIEISEDG